MPSSDITIKGAREHNLKNVDITIPRGKLVVITGVSGSGKSSLAFDTIYAEGQRRYVESLSSYARQFISQMQKPLLDQPENQFGSQPVVRGAGIASGIALTRFLHSTVTVRTLTAIETACRGLWALPGWYIGITARKLCTFDATDCERRVAGPQTV